MLRTESGGNADDDTLSLQLLGQVDLVAGGVLDQDVEIGDGVSLLNESRRGAVEQRPLRQGAGDGSETTSSEHCVTVELGR